MLLHTQSLAQYHGLSRLSQNARSYCTCGSKLKDPKRKQCAYSCSESTFQLYNWCAYMTGTGKPSKPNSYSTSCRVRCLRTRKDEQHLRVHINWYWDGLHTVCRLSANKARSFGLRMAKTSVVSKMCSMRSRCWVFASITIDLRIAEKACGRRTSPGSTNHSQNR